MFAMLLLTLEPVTQIQQSSQHSDISSTLGLGPVEHLFIAVVMETEIILRH